MPFENPVVGGTQLVRNAIKSANYAQGLAGWRIGRDGSSEFDSMSLRTGVASPKVAADSSLTYKGVELQTILDARGRGLVAFGQAVNNGTLWGTGTQGPIATMSFVAHSGRSYIVKVNGLEQDCSTAGRALQYSLKFTIDGTVPTSASPNMAGGIGNVPYAKVNTSGNSNGMEGWYSQDTGVDVVLKVGLFLLVGEGDVTSTQSVWAGNSWMFYAMDIGPTSASGLITGVVTFNAPGASGNPGTVHDDTWFALSSRSYDQNGNLSSATNSDVYAYQGDGTAVGNPGGDTCGLHFFDSATIRAALVGATILHTYAYVQDLHSYLNSGITAILGTHGSDPKPATIPARSQNRWNLALSPRGGDAWTADLGAALGVEWQNGGTRGFCFGYGGVGVINNYGYMNTSAIRIIYSK